MGPLTNIVGFTDDSVGDLVDSYSIIVTDPAAFYATTESTVDPTAFADFDTRLWLWEDAPAIIFWGLLVFWGQTLFTVSDGCSKTPPTLRRWLDA